MINIGINGFGRIGRLLSREIMKSPKFSLAAVNHPSINKDEFKYLLENDTAHGLFTMDTEQQPDIYNFKSPRDIPWKPTLDIIIDTTGKFKELSEITPHINELNHDTKIIVSAPSNSLPMFVYGANHQQYNNQQFISAASCTTTCLAPLVDIIHNEYGIENGLATTIHSVTASQNAVDKFKSGSRTGRSLFNIIPSSTGAAASIGKIIPALEGKLDAIGVRVPVVNVSLLDLTLNLKNAPTLDTLIEHFYYKNATVQYKNIIALSDNMNVSSDFIGSSMNAIIDVPSCKKIDNTYKIIAWYDNEYGYTHSVLRLMEHISNKKF